jgi:hypothetical protein
MLRYRWSVFGVLMTALVVAAVAWGESKPAASGSGKRPGTQSDVELVERLLATRHDYQVALEELRKHYVAAGDVERARNAEEELRQYHRINKQAYNMDLEMLPPTLQAANNVPEANELYRRAMTYKDKGWNSDYIDNQRRAEILLQQLLTSYPQCDKIGDAAFQLGDIYESKACKQYLRAALYYERCFQWKSHLGHEARIRAAHLYDKQLLDRTKAKQLYTDVTTHDTDTKRIEEAKKRLAELSSRK